MLRRVEAAGGGTVKPQRNGTKGKGKIMNVKCYADDKTDPELIGEGIVDLTETLKTGEFDGEWSRSVWEADCIAAHVSAILRRSQSASRRRARCADACRHDCCSQLPWCRTQHSDRARLVGDVSLSAATYASAADWVTIKARDRYAGEVYLELTFYSSVRCSLSLASCGRGSLLLPRRRHRQRRRRPPHGPQCRAATRTAAPAHSSLTSARSLAPTATCRGLLLRLALRTLAFPAPCGQATGALGMAVACPTHGAMPAPSRHRQTTERPSCGRAPAWRRSTPISRRMPQHAHTRQHHRRRRRESRRTMRAPICGAIATRRIRRRLRASRPRARTRWTTCCVRSAR
jgi:hypothetical protein